MKLGSTRLARERRVWVCGGMSVQCNTTNSVSPIKLHKHARKRMCVFLTDKAHPHPYTPHHIHTHCVSISNTYTQYTFKHTSITPESNDRNRVFVNVTDEFPTSSSSTTSSLCVCFCMCRSADAKPHELSPPPPPSLPRPREKHERPTQ